MKNKGLLAILGLGFVLVLIISLMAGYYLNELNGEAIANGNVISKEVSAKEFDGMVLNGVADVNIHSSESYKVVVTTDSNIQDNIAITVDNNILRIDTEYNNFFWHNPPKVTIDIYTPELKNVELNGVGDIKILNGKSSDLKIKLSGVGDIDARNYEVENVNITLHGTGDIKVWATDTLTGKFSGVGDVLYKGDPLINIDTNGIGRVKRL